MKLFPLILALTFLLGGCGYGTDVENQAFVVAVGIDKGETFPVKATFVFADPSASGGEDKPSSPKSDILTVEAPTVFSAIRKIDSIKSKTINMSHVKVVVFSDIIASEGIHGFLSGFASSRDFRPNTYVCVSRGESGEYLRAVNPAQETFIEKYFDNIMRKVAHDKVNEAYLYYLYFSVMEDFSGSLVPLVGINPNKADETAPDITPYTDDLSYEAKAGEIVRDAENPTEILGSAVFLNDKMIDTIGSFETDIARIISGEYYPRDYSIYYPDKENLVTVRLIQQKRPTIKGNLRNGTADISVEVPLSIEYVDAGKIENKKSESKEFLSFLEEQLNSKAEKLISSAQKTYQSDILGFGEALKHEFLDIGSWKNFNWKKNFPEARIKVSFKVLYADFEEAN